MVVAEQPEIFPVNFVVDERTIVFRTSEGTKLAELTISPQVALEADGYDPESGETWSVVVKGRAHRLDHFEDIYAAEQLPIFPWQAGIKQWFVRVAQTSVTGIRFIRQRDAD